MTQYNALNVKLSSSQLNRLNYATKNGTVVTLNLSSNIAGDSNDKNKHSHKLLLTNTQILKLHKDLSNSLSANMKLSKTQLHKTGQSGEFLGRLFGPLLKPALALIGNVLKQLAN